MSSTKQTQQVLSPVRTEAELESRMAAALSIAFPNISRNELVEQRRFKVRLGHEVHEFDSAAQWEKSGRADIIIFYNERPLAVVELKREDLKLTHADYEQAQSYANQLTPRPPLVIVTNGTNTDIYDSNTGHPWSGEQDAKEAVSRLLANASKLAKADMRWATEALLGRETGVWVPIVRSATENLLAQMTDPCGVSNRPFAEGLLLNRHSTSVAIKSVLVGTKFTIIEGTAQSGKSSCLREFALQTNCSENIAVFMFRSTGPGLFQSLANLFAIELNWNLTANDARQWLRRMSTGSEGPILLLAIDDVVADSLMASDLEELANLRLGNKLKVILTTDDANRLIKTPNGRTQTAMGELADVIKVGPLELKEFEEAKETLFNHKIIFESGAEYVQDYRAPWILRMIYDSAVRNPQYKEKGKFCVIPPSLGVELVDLARQSYEHQSDLLRGYRVLARSALADSDTYPAELQLAVANGFFVRQDALSEEARHALIELKSKGAVRTYRHVSREDVVVPTIPAAFLSEFADVVSEELKRRVEVSPKEAGTWLGNRLATIYLGDLIGAQAIRSMAEKTGSFSSGIVEGLLDMEPIQECMGNGIFMMNLPDDRMIYLKIEGNQSWICDRHGEVISEPFDIEEEGPNLLVNTVAWMILGQLARCPSVEVGGDGKRMDAWILFKIGQCPFPLLRVNEEGIGHLVHDLGSKGRVLCHKHGPIEATTQAMVSLFVNPWEDSDEWVNHAIRIGSQPLLHRLAIALRVVRERNIPELSTWANMILRDRVIPMLTCVH